MLNRPKALDPVDTAQFEERLEAFEEQSKQSLSSRLNTIGSTPVREQLEVVAFRESPIFPKRDHRPHVRTPYLAEQLYRFGSANSADDETLRCCNIMYLEYVDMVDDLVDGDIKDGRELDVIVTAQLLLPLIVGELGALGVEAVRYWSDRTANLTNSIVIESIDEQTLENYLSIIDTQSWLYGTVTGLAGVVADATTQRVEHYERLGRIYFKYDQILTDLYQYHTSDVDEAWNAWALVTEAEVKKMVHAWGERGQALASELGPEVADRIQPLFAVDVDATISVAESM